MRQVRAGGTPVGWPKILTVGDLKKRTRGCREIMQVRVTRTIGVDGEHGAGLSSHTGCCPATATFALAQDQRRFASTSS